MASQRTSNTLALSLGWFSVGLGLAELMAPGSVSRLVGVRPRPNLLRCLGLRELGTGIGLLTRRHPDKWLTARVAGDVLDLALLGVAFTASSARTALTAVTAAVAGVTALDVISARTVSRSPALRNGASRVTKVVTINRPAEELYERWHRFQDLPQFMNHLESVTVDDEKRSHWVAKGPAGTRVEWDAEITQDEPNRLIAWRSLEGSDVTTSGAVRFYPATGGRGTVVRVELEYHPPAGKLGVAVANILGQAPEKQVAVDLLRFKQLVETGEIARTEGQPAGRARSTSRKYDDLLRK